MTVGSDTKVILLPKESSNQLSFKILKLPLDSKGVLVKSFLLGGNELFELLEVKGVNSFSNKNTVLLKNGTSVKSFVFEGDGNSHSLILQSPNVLVATKFNLVFLLILIMYKNDSFNKRFITLEDFIDSITEIYEDKTWVYEIPKELFATALRLICELIEENGEEFFKFSIQKTIAFLTSKVESLTQFIKSKPNSIIMKIRAELIDPTNTEPIIPENILDISILKHALYLICNSYITEDIIEDLKSLKNYLFKELDDYMKSMNIKKKEIETVESGMNEIASTSSKVRNKKKVEIKKKATKKTVKKVAVGKGALDGFFKKA